MNRADCKVKNLRCQRRTYCSEEKELTKAEYLRLLEAAKKNKRLHLILQTICGTGIRISELKYFTVEAVRKGEIVVRCKSKIRTILIPSKLKKLLIKNQKEYIEDMIAKRNVAKANKDFNEADRIRQELLNKNILLKDTREGTIYELI